MPEDAPPSDEAPAAGEAAASADVAPAAGEPPAAEDAPAASEAAAPDAGAVDMCSRADDIQPSVWFRDRWREVQKTCKELRKKQTEWREVVEQLNAWKKEEGAGAAEDEKPTEVDAEDVDVMSVENVEDIGSGEPLFAKFVLEDWSLLSLRMELHLLVHAFRRDVGDPAKRFFHEKHLEFYYQRYFKNSLALRFYGAETCADLIDLVQDTIKLGAGSSQSEPGELGIAGLLDAVHGADERAATFVKLTEEDRRDRIRRWDAGDETAKLRFGRAKPGEQEEEPEEPEAPEATVADSRKPLSRMARSTGLRAPPRRTSASSASGKETTPPWQRERMAGSSSAVGGGSSSSSSRRPSSGGGSTSTGTSNGHASQRHPVGGVPPPKRPYTSRDGYDDGDYPLPKQARSRAPYDDHRQAHEREPRDAYRQRGSYDDYDGYDDRGDYRQQPRDPPRGRNGYGSSGGRDPPSVRSTSHRDVPPPRAPSRSYDDSGRGSRGAPRDAGGRGSYDEYRDRPAARGYYSRPDENHQPRSGGYRAADADDDGHARRSSYGGRSAGAPAIGSSGGYRR